MYSQTDRVLERLFRFRIINIVGSDCRGFTLNLAPPLISTLYLLLPGLNFMPDLVNFGDEVSAVIADGVEFVRRRKMCNDKTSPLSFRGLGRIGRRHSRARERLSLQRP